MSGLEAFSLVCNVMTVISFGIETAKLCRSIHESGSSDPELAKHAQWIRENSEQLLTPQQPPTTEAEKRLQNIASECLQCTKDIEEEVKYVSPKKTGFFRAMKSTVKTIRRRPHLDQLKDRLHASQTTMDTTIISHVLKECISSGKINQSNYETLIRDQTAFNLAHEQQAQVVNNLIGQFHDSIKKEIAKALGNIEDKIDVVDARNYDRQAHEKLLQSLKYDGMNERKNAIPRRHKKTFKWIFEGLRSDDSSQSDSELESSSESDTASSAESSDAGYEEQRRMDGAATAKTNQRDANFLGWLQEDSRDLYWISGKPGSGKSTLTKFIMADKRTKTALRIWRPSPEIISHFLWKPGSDRQQNLHGLLCSLLYQVLVDDANVTAQLLQHRPTLRQKSKADDWDSEDLEKVLFEAIRDTSRSYLIILDGLDELSKPHGGIEELFGLLNQFKAEDGVKLCVSSRPEKRFEERFSSGQFLRMQDLTFQDILNYTLATLNDITPEAGEHTKDKIATEISERSEGVFIWVHIVLQSVKNGIYEFNETWDDIYDRITELPRDLMELYKEMWSRLGEDSKKYAKQAALYFQLVHMGHTILHSHFRSLACLAVASDESIMETCTGETSPHILSLVERCERTHRTLHSISSGLLEASNSFFALFPTPTQPSDGNHPESSHNWDVMDESLNKQSPEGLRRALEKWTSEEAFVRFTHRTAIDFLDSDEGKRLFGRYMLNEKAIFLKLFRSAITLGSIFNFRHPAKFLINHLLGIFSRYYGAREYSDDFLDNPRQPRCPDTAAYAVINVFYECAARVEGIFGPWKLSGRAYFIFLSAHNGLCEFVAGILQTSECGNIETADSALMGACCVTHYGRALCSGQKRCDLIQRCLQSPHRRVPDSSRNIITAWRCFLQHQLVNTNQFWSYSPDNSIIENILETFISAGVMDQQPPPRYLIAVTNERWLDSPFRILKTLDDYRLNYIFDYGIGQMQRCTLYLEVNDNFFLKQLARRVSAKSDLILQNAHLGFGRLLFGAQHSRETKYFTCKPKNVEEREALEKWIFEDFMSSAAQAQLLHSVPPHLKMEELEGFDKSPNALKAFGAWQTDSSYSCFQNVHYV